MSTYRVTFENKDNVINITVAKAVGIIPAIDIAKKSFYKLAIDNLLDYEIVKVEKVLD